MESQPVLEVSRQGLFSPTENLGQSCPSGHGPFRAARSWPGPWEGSAAPKESRVRPGVEFHRGGSWGPAGAPASGTGA